MSTSVPPPPRPTGLPSSPSFCKVKGENAATDNGIVREWILAH